MINVIKTRYSDSRIHDVAKGIPQVFIASLIEIGKRADLETTDISPQLEALRSYEHFLGGSWGYWQHWRQICEPLPVEDHVALLKALVLAGEHFPIFGIGSGASAIWPYRTLDKKLPYRQSHEIALWVIAHSSCPWLPFGNQRDLAYFKQWPEKFEGDFSGSLVQRIHFERSNDRCAIFEKEAQQKEERKQERQRKHQERLAKKAIRDKERIK